MDKFNFFDLIFEQYDTKISKSYMDNDTNKQRVKDKKIDSGTTVADEFTRFFYTHNLTPLFTNEFRMHSIEVRLPDAESLIKNGGRANRVFTEFSNLMSHGLDNKRTEDALAKILYQSKNWRAFVKNVEDHNIYVTYIVENAHLHNAWNIVWYDKDKTGYAQGKAARAN